MMGGGNRLGVPVIRPSHGIDIILGPVMEVLAAASEGNAPPEFFSTHPNPNNRIARIEAAIEELYPTGVPAGLDP